MFNDGSPLQSSYDDLDGEEIYCAGAKGTTGCESGNAVSSSYANRWVDDETIRRFFRLIEPHFCVQAEPERERQLLLPVHP